MEVLRRRWPGGYYQRRDQPPSGNRRPGRLVGWRALPVAGLGVDVGVGVGLPTAGQGADEHETCTGGGPDRVGRVVGVVVMVRVLDGVSVTLGVDVLVARFV